MKGWETKKLGDVTDLIARGIAPRYLEAGGIRVLNQKCIRDHGINYEFARRHDDTIKNVSKDRLVRFADGLINSTGVGTLGRVAQVREQPDEPTTVDTHVTIVRPKVGLFFPEFFGYMLIYIEDEISSSGEGASGQTELARSTLAEKLKVSYPRSISEQRRIVAILDEAFAGLEVVRANAEENLANARELFDVYKNAAFERKGNGWISRPLGECFRLKSGDGLTSKAMIPGRYSVFGGNGIAGTHDQYNLSGDNVIIGRVGALCGNARHIEENIWLTDNAFRVVDRKYEFDSAFLTYLLNFKNLGRLARQSAQPVISNSSLQALELSFPLSRGEQRQIVERLDVINTESSSLSKLYARKLTAIAELKQSLLQKAFSGQLTASESLAA